MPITTKCPSCGQTIAAPDYAAGHKARCPHCRAVMEIPDPAGAKVAAALAHEALVHEAAPSAAEALAMETRRAAVALATATPRTNPPSPSSVRTPSRSGLRSSTIIDRMILRTSPYGTLRTLGSVIFGVGIVMTVLVFFGGVGTMLVLAIGGRPVIGLAILGGAVVLAFLMGVAAKTLHELIRLAADVGDRARQTQMMLDDLANHPRDETL
jgi:hypothetical protein